MNYVTRRKLARLVRFFKPAPAKIRLSVDEILGTDASMDVVNHRLARVSILCVGIGVGGIR